MRTLGLLGRDIGGTAGLVVDEGAGGSFCGAAVYASRPCREDSCFVAANPAFVFSEGDAAKRFCGVLRGVFKVLIASPPVIFGFVAPFDVMPTGPVY